MNKKKSAPSKSPARIKRTGRAEADSPVNEAGERANATSRKSARRAQTNSAAVEKRAEEKQAENTSFPVVGIGASAGGLEAFRQLLDHLPVDTGMAFVLVSHLDPTHKSILTELLARRTKLPVSEVSDGMRVEPDHVYVMPPNTSMAIAEGVLRLRPREEGRAGRYPVDHFLRTLAEDQSHRAIGVIMSGTDSDGTLGLEAIKAEGGITFAQEPKSAKYDGMPRSAIAAGHVDFILPPEGIAQELARISRHPYVDPVAAATPAEEEPPPTGRNGFRKILMLLRKAKGVDFTDYKATTLHRRIARRMVLNKLESMEDYFKFLREDAAEVEALYQDILISVTSFFRNPEAFAVLKEKIFPQIVGQRTPDEPIRIWTLGCSTGEEAYSIAMSFVEFAADQAEHIPVQIFATDLSDRGIEKARAGLYPKDIAEDVAPERLRRFFTEAEGGYRVSKPIRDMIVFARQNVITDPPFSRLDLISCRNLLIYLEPVLQKRVLPLLHYALKPTGVLWLGTSETPGSSSDLFAPEEKQHRFYSKKPAAARFHFQVAHNRAGSGQQRNYVSQQMRDEHNAEKEADRILLARYSPASVLINTELEILQFRGSTGAYLQPPAGKATLNLLKMAREGLMLPLRAAIQKAKKDDATIRKEGVRIDYEGEFWQVNLEVVPIKGLAANERCFLVLFEPVSPQNLSQEIKPLKAQAGRTQRKTEDRQVARLQEELATTREYMQSLVEQQEAANEELQSSSEEIQSSNEELQSINEELETAKEELESSNEELTTLNDELQNRNRELTTFNDDLNNLHVSTNLPILMLDRDLRIRRFTPQAEKVLNLIAADVERPIGDIKLKINVPDLEGLIAEVIDSDSVREREVQDRDGRWYAMRVRPYKTLDNRIDGAVLVLVDIDALKRSEAEIREARDYAESIVRTVPNPLLILNADLRVHTANEAFYGTFKVAPAEAEGRLIYELGNRQWNIPRLRELLEDILPRNSFFNNFEVTQEFETIGQRTMLLNARMLSGDSGQAARILLGIQDITELLQFQAAVRRSEIRYRRLFEAARDGVLLLDPQTRKILDANPYMTELLGYTREELLGKELFEIGLLKDEVASRAAFLELQEQGFIRYDDLPLETKTGERREVEFVSNLYQEDGEKIVQCNIRNITERKQAEQALAEQARLLDLSNDAIIVRDMEGRIVYWNHGAAALYGWPREEALGKVLHSLLQTEFPKPFEQITEELYRNNRWEGESTHTKRDGRRVTVLVRKALARDSQGNPTAVLETTTDISERKRAEEALRESEERFRTLVAQVKDYAIFSTDTAGRATTWNEGVKRIFGFDEEEFIGKDIAQTVFTPEDVRAGVVDQELQTAAAEGSVSDDRWLQRKDETRFFASGIMTALRDESETVIGFSKVLRDITDRKQVEEERERLLALEQQARQEADEANRMKDEFLATVSHELRTPLNSILGWANTLLRGKLDEQVTTRALENIERNARAQNQLIADLLDVSRIISGKLRFEVGAVDLSSVIEAALETVRPAADAKGVELRLTLDRTAGLVSGDDTRLQQVVWNLLANAIKYTPRGGHVETRLEREGTHAVIIVRDTGEGINADFLPYVFARFSQADGTTTRKQGGLGLGLAIVRHLVEAHGGQVHAASEGAGRGAIFTVTLPLIALRNADFRLRDEAAVDEHSAVLTGLRVLVVDDELDARELLSWALTQGGAEVRTVASAAEAFDILSQWQPEVMISDIGMPSEDGYELIRQVRALPDERGGQIPAVALTGYARLEDQRRALAAGYQIFVPKPVELNELAAAIARLAGRTGKI